MRKLDFRVGYTVTLFSFVDSLSRWDHFVSEHIRKYFEADYVFNSEDLSYLELYSKHRKHLDWNREADLLNWAHAGFPDNTEFDDLLSCIKHFERKTNKDGETLKSELQRATEQLSDILHDVKDGFNKLDVENKISAFADLFECPDTTGALPCYLTYSPDKHHSQGGSNGEGIYTEVILNLDKPSQIKESIEVIVHEYVHKEINPGRYFKNFPDVEVKKIYNTKFPDIYPDSLFSFVEEVIVYALNDVLLFGTEASDEVKYYLEESDKEMLVMWKAVETIVPFLLDYRANKKSAKETIYLLDKHFQSLIN